MKITKLQLKHLIKECLKEVSTKSLEQGGHVLIDYEDDTKYDSSYYGIDFFDGFITIDGKKYVNVHIPSNNKNQFSGKNQENEACFPIKNVTMPNVSPLPINSL